MNVLSYKMAEDDSILWTIDDKEQWMGQQANQAALILTRLADIDKQQNNMAMRLGDVMNKLNTMAGMQRDNSKVARDGNVALDRKETGEHSGNTTSKQTSENEELRMTVLKSMADLEERQTQILVLLESMNKALVRENQEFVNQVREMREKQDDFQHGIVDLKEKWSLLSANIFRTSFLVIGTSAFIVFTTVVVARKINKRNLYYRLSISSIVSDILKRNKTSVSTAEIVSKLRDILVTPTANLKDATSYS